jgi:L-rhamnose-H+ transport protein
LSQNLGLGVLIVVLGGCMEGTYAICMKYVPRWRWEHIWGASCVAALALVAWPVTFLTVPSIGSVFSEVGLKNLLWPTVFGLAWGAGSIFFGLGVDAVGLAVGVSVIMGLIAVVGSGLPLLIYHPEQFDTTAGHVLVAALAIMLVGIFLCGLAGNARDRSLAQESDAITDDSSGVPSKKRPSFRIGLLYCVLSGLLSPLLNFALITGDNLRLAAIRHGASTLWAINSVWILVFTVAYSLNILYAIYVAIKNKSISELSAPGTKSHWGLAAIMGVLWAGGIVVYGVGVSRMGALGAYAAWPLLLIAAIAASNVSGIVMGEWKRTNKKAKVLMGSALVVLVLAAILVGFANRMMSA